MWRRVGSPATIARAKPSTIEAASISELLEAGNGTRFSSQGYSRSLARYFKKQPKTSGVEMCDEIDSAKAQLFTPRW